MATRRKNKPTLFEILLPLGFIVLSLVLLLIVFDEGFASFFPRAARQALTLADFGSRRRPPTPRFSSQCVSYTQINTNPQPNQVQPHGVAVLPNNHLIVTDKTPNDWTSGPDVQSFFPHYTADQSFIASNLNSGSRVLGAPTRVAFRPDTANPGQWLVYIADNENVSGGSSAKILQFRYNPGGQNGVTRLSDWGAGIFPYGLTFDSNNNLYAAASNAMQPLTGVVFKKYNTSGVDVTAGTSWPNITYGTGPSQVQFVTALAQFNNTIYAVDTNREANPAANNNRIQKFTLDGVSTGTIGSYGSGNLQFNNPGDVAVDSEGFIYVADFGNNRIQKIDPTNNTLKAQFSVSSPRGVAVDANGLRVYVTSGTNLVTFQCGSVTPTPTPFPSPMTQPIARYSFNSPPDSTTSDQVNNSGVFNYHPYPLMLWNRSVCMTSSTDSVPDDMTGTDIARRHYGTTYCNMSLLQADGGWRLRPAVFTASAWVKQLAGTPPTTPSTTKPIIVHSNRVLSGAATEDFKTGFGLFMDRTNDTTPIVRYGMFIGNKQTNSLMTGPVAWDVNAWHHVAAVYAAATPTSPGTMSLYVDGVQVAGPVASTLPLKYETLATHYGPVFYIGNNYYSSATSQYPFYGALDDVRLYNRALTGAELCQLVLIGNPTAPCGGITPTNTNTPTPTSIPGPTNTPTPTTPPQPSPIPTPICPTGVNCTSALRVYGGIYLNNVPLSCPNGINTTWNPSIPPSGAWNKLSVSFNNNAPFAYTCPSTFPMYSLYKTPIAPATTLTSGNRTFDIQLYYWSSLQALTPPGTQYKVRWTCQAKTRGSSTYNLTSTFCSAPASVATSDDLYNKEDGSRFTVPSTADTLNADVIVNFFLSL